MAFADLNAWVDFELGEDVRDEARLLQDEQWAGAVQDGRAHVSHREAAKLHRTQFIDSVKYYRTSEAVVDCYMTPRSRLYRVQPELLRHVVDFLCAQGALVVASIDRRILSDKYNKETADAQAQATNATNLRLIARKRPLLAFETEAEEYNCIDASLAQAELCITLHDGRLARNGRRLTMCHRTYRVDSVVDESISNEVFCGTECDRLLNHALLGGKSATLLCFGQTGAGKTHSFIGCLWHLCEQLKTVALSVTFYEIHGKNAHDLLNERKQVFLRADEKDDMHVRGAKIGEMSGDEGDQLQLLTLLRQAVALRSSQATERNPLSSRSHAVCTLRLRDSGGCIRLVDLAGSERNYETTKMSAKQHRESADINKSLWALKECFAAAHSPTSCRLPYREHLLTRVLKDCFIGLRKQHDDGQAHLTTLICAVAPAPTDTMHSVNTLDHGVMLNPFLCDKKSSVTVEIPLVAGAALSHVAVEQWTTAQVTQWLSTAEGGRFSALQLPIGLDGKGLMQLNTSSLTALFAGQLRKARQGEEGSAWVIDTGVAGESGNDSTRTSAIGRALWSCLRRETISANAKRSTMQFL